MSGFSLKLFLIASVLVTTSPVMARLDETVPSTTAEATSSPSFNPAEPPPEEAKSEAKKSAAKAAESSQKSEEATTKFCSKNPYHRLCDPCAGLTGSFCEKLSEKATPGSDVQAYEEEPEKNAPSAVKKAMEEKEKDEKPPTPATRAALPAAAPTPAPRPSDRLGEEEKPEAAQATENTAATDMAVSATAANNANRCLDNSLTAMRSCETAVNNAQSSKAEFDRLNARLRQQAGSSAASVCQQMSQTANQAAGRLQADLSPCQQAVQSCQNICGQAVGALRSYTSSESYVRASRGQAQCDSANSKASSVAMNLGQVQTAATQANRCYDQATAQTPAANDNANAGGGGGGGAGFGASDFANSGSSAPGQGQGQNAAPLDCTHPQMLSSNPVCICRANPSHPDCGLSKVYSGSQPDSDSRSANPKSSTSPNTGQAATGAIDLDSGASGRLQWRDRSASPGASVLAGSRSGLILSSDGSPSPMQGSAARGRSDGEANYGSGNTRRGGGYVGSYEGSPRSVSGIRPITRPNSTGNYASGSGTQRTAAASSGKNKYLRGVDLRRFLPDGSLRAPGSSADGIGGAHTNIFMTIRARYLRQADSFEP